MSKPQLFMFHFAGGNSYSFKFMNPYLQEFTIEPIELPGRGRRSGEILITDFHTAAKDVYKQIRSKLNSKHFLIYGHSMGAYLALKVTKMLEHDNISPVGIIVTGNAGPKISENKKRYLLNEKDFVKEVKKLGGLPSEVLENQELLDYFMPILKADFEISEENNLERDSTINVPIYSLMGDTEEHADKITNWSKYTRSDFKHEVLSGDHFFIYNHPERLAKIITKHYHDHVIEKKLS
ncbi:surfactin synthase thioesterase subunit [Pedobacter cryoconitis]|uniref:thioesterase II family protein n=1 Tax=Pedobacter cryoconitis TaxID=188932 RepID=UPI00160BDA9D|nr:alpha/beta fold hydrolase [Pedobacter cryoconitis]MBB6269859.1 surfactin synthase thioesterase subunit [Pedobacter cryoconitis]